MLPDKRALALPDQSLTRGDVVLLVLVWAGFAMFTLGNRVLALGWNRSRGSLPEAAGVAFAESACWALLTPVIFWLVSRAEDRADSRMGQMLLVAAGGVAIIPLMGVLGTWFRVWFDVGPGPGPLPMPRPRIVQGPGPGFGFGGGLRPPIRVGIWLGSLNSLIIYAGISAAGFARVYSWRYRARQQHAAQLEVQLASAQLDALRRQLDPHFLFNTLNLISSLTESDPKGVRSMIARLSELLRFSLETDVGAHSLREELDLLERYLDIMRMRFAGRLRVTTRIDPNALDAVVPSFILQPLVENAILHGTGKGVGEGRVDIHGVVERETLTLRVTDNGPAGENAVSARPGVGIRNTMARLEGLYGSRGAFTLTGSASGAIAEIRIPFRSPNVLHARGITHAGSTDLVR